MKAGFNLLLWTSHVTEKHFPIIEKLAKAGYDGVEVPILEGTPASYEKVRAVIRDNGLLCDVVTNMPDVQHNPLSPDRKQRQNALDFMKRVIDCTRALDAGLLCGPFYQPVGLFTGAGPSEEEKGRAADPWPGRRKPAWPRPAPICFAMPSAWSLREFMLRRTPFARCKIFGRPWADGPYE